MGAPLKPPHQSADGEFLWLMSLSDLMILLFIFFVVLFSFTYKKLNSADVQQILATLRNETPPATPLDVVKTKFDQWTKEQNLTEQVSVVHKDNAVLVEIKDKVLFGSGQASPLDAGINAIRQLTPILEKVPESYRIGIEGHTDDVPIHTATIDDNWDLSGKRALAVLHTLELSPATLKRTVLMSYGEMQPVVPNRTPDGIPLSENQSKNRRVTIRIF